MNENELAETVLMQLECFWILQELDHKIKCGNGDAKKIMSDIYQGRLIGDNWSKMEFIQIKTTLPMLTLPICLLCRLDEQGLQDVGFEVGKRHNTTCRVTNGPENTTWALRVIRNALAHLPDFVAGKCNPNVTFDEGVVKLKSERLGEIVFNDEKGFVEFVRDVIRASRKYAGQLLDRNQQSDQLH